MDNYSTRNQTYPKPYEAYASGVFTISGSAVDHSIKDNTSFFSVLQQPYEVLLRNGAGDLTVGKLIPHSPRHKRERAWYRFYIDHGRLPVQIDYMTIHNNTLTIDHVENVLDLVAEAYKAQHGFDVLNPSMDKEADTLILEGF